MRRLKKTRQPVVLTVNGKAELIVQDAVSYQEVLERLDRLEAIEGIRAGLDSVKSGRGRPAAEVFENVRRKLRLAPGPWSRKSS